LGTLISASGSSNAQTLLLGSATGTDKTITLPNATGTIALTSHTHGNIASDGRFVNLGAIAGVTYISNIDTLANGTYSVIQSGHSGVVSTVVVGGTAGAKTVSPTNSGTGYSLGSATYGSNFSINITSVTGSNLPLITSSSGVITTSTFGTTANSFCQGNDARLGSQTIFTLGGEAKTVFALSTSYLYGCMPTRGPQLSGSYTNAVLQVLGNFTVTGISIHQYLPSLTGATLTYQLVRVANASTVVALGSSVVVAGNNNLTTSINSISASLSSGDSIGLMLTLGASGTVPVATAATTVLANIYCVPR
jgi:hypothetical protein